MHHSEPPAIAQDEELDLSHKINAAQKLVHERLCDNVDTAGAMDAISSLIKNVNQYLAKKEGGGSAGPPQALLLRKVRWSLCDEIYSPFLTHVHIWGV